MRYCLRGLGLKLTSLLLSEPEAEYATRRRCSRLRAARRSAGPERRDGREAVPRYGDSEAPSFPLKSRPLFLPPSSSSHINQKP